MTLEQAKAWLRERFDRGATCPCCRQFVKLYKRSITSSMARGLIVLYRHQRKVGADLWVHLPTLINSVCPSNMGALLRHWGLIEQQPGTRDDGSWRVGYYRMTDLGRAFVERRINVPKYVFLYNQTPLQRQNETSISIEFALTKRFRYDELMAA
jgi:hypothetical protein